MSFPNGIDRADCNIPVYCIYLNATQIEYFVFLLTGDFIVFLSIYSFYLWHIIPLNEWAMASSFSGPLRRKYKRVGKSKRSWKRSEKGHFLLFMLPWCYTPNFLRKSQYRCCGTDLTAKWHRQHGTSLSMENKNLATSWVKSAAAKRRVADELYSSVQMNSEWLQSVCIFKLDDNYLQTCLKVISVSQVGFFRVRWPPTR